MDDRTIGDKELIDTFAMAGQMIAKLDAKINQIVDCMHDAVQGQRRGSFQDLLSSKYSNDLGPLDQFYTDTFGNRFSDQLMNELLDSDMDNPDDYISSKINETKGKYGKYLGAVASDPNVPVGEMGYNPEPTETEVPTPKEIGAPPEAPEMGGVEIAVKAKGRKKPSSKDMADLLGLKLSKV
jgi:hypothetical protein